MATTAPLSSVQVVEISTALPDVLLKEGVNWTSITFKGRGFAWINHAEDRAMVKARHAEREALLATAPDVYEPGWTSDSTAWVTIHLELADPEEVSELLEEAWRLTATKKVITAYDALCSRQDPAWDDRETGQSPQDEAVAVLPAQLLVRDCQSQLR